MVRVFVHDIQYGDRVAESCLLDRIETILTISLCPSYGIIWSTFFAIAIASPFCRNKKCVYLRALLGPSTALGKEGKEQESAQPSPGCSLYRWPVWAQKGPTYWLRQHKPIERGCIERLYQEFVYEVV